jgi:sialate O-acetylesterase
MNRRGDSSLKMRRIMLRRFVVPVSSLFLLFAAAVSAEVKPSALFSDHMVLQSGISVPVWGKAEPGEVVKVTLKGQSQSATAGQDGKWMVRLGKLKAGGPYEMQIQGKNTITVKDVLVGEVWLGSGQSNMAFTV